MNPAPQPHRLSPHLRRLSEILPRLIDMDLIFSLSLFLGSLSSLPSPHGFALGNQIHCMSICTCDIDSCHCLLLSSLPLLEKTPFSPLGLPLLLPPALFLVSHSRSCCTTVFFAPSSSRTPEEMLSCSISLLKKPACSTSLRIASIAVLCA